MLAKLALFYECFTIMTFMYHTRQPCRIYICDFDLSVKGTFLLSGVTHFSSCCFTSYVPACAQYV
jgi:hypothetical protein